MEDELDRDWVEGFSGLKEDWQVIDTAKTCTLVFDWFLNPDKSGNWEICISV